METEEFIRMLAQEGYAEPVVVEREPNGSMELHTHPFEAKALILDGEIRLLTGTREQVFHAGEVFHLKSGEPHHESYGNTGVRYLVGRKSPQ